MWKTLLSFLQRIPLLNSSRLRKIQNLHWQTSSNILICITVYEILAETAKGLNLTCPPKLYDRQNHRMFKLQWPRQNGSQLKRCARSWCTTFSTWSHLAMDRDNSEVYMAPNGSSLAPRSFLTWGVCGSHGALITTPFPAAGCSSSRPAAADLCSRAVTPLCHFSSWRCKLEPHGSMHNPVTCSTACATQSVLRSVYFLHSLLFTIALSCLLDTW